MKGEFFSEKEINPTVRMGYTVTQSEKAEFEDFAKKMGIPLAALVRVAVKTYMATEGKKYEK